MKLDKRATSSSPFGVAVEVNCSKLLIGDEAPQTRIKSMQRCVKMVFEQ